MEFSHQSIACARREECCSRDSSHFPWVGPRRRRCLERNLLVPVMGVANNLPAHMFKAIRTSLSRKRAISPHPARTNNYIHDVNYLILWSRTHSGLDLARPFFPPSRMRRKNGLVHETTCPHTPLEGWTAPLPPPPPPLSEILDPPLGYSVRYGDMGSGSPQTVTVSEREVTIQGLISSTTYSIEVAAVNSAGVGVYSYPITTTKSRPNSLNSSTRIMFLHYKCRLVFF